MARGTPTICWTLTAALMASPVLARQGFDVPDAASAVVLEPGPSRSADSPALLELVWIDVEAAAPGLLERAMAEARAVLDAAGLRYRYRRAAVDSQTGPDDVRVIVLPHSRAPQAPGRLVMGAVNARFARPGEARAIWAFVSPIVGALGLTGVEQDPDAVAVALGRVVAHEMVHIMVPHLGHAKDGLMSAVLSAQDLRGRRQGMGETFLRALRGPDLKDRRAGTALRTVGRR
jgi:hypothetical protein